MLRDSAQGVRGGNCNVPSRSGASSEHRRDTTGTPRPLGTDQTLSQRYRRPAGERRGGQAPTPAAGRGGPAAAPGSPAAPRSSPQGPTGAGAWCPHAGAAASGPAPVPRRGSERPRFSGSSRPRGRPRFAGLASAWLAGKTKRRQGKENGKKVRLPPPPSLLPGSPCMRQRCKRILTGGRGWREEKEEDGQREGGRKGGREGGTNGSLSPSLGCFFQFPVSHCAHSGYVLRLQVCPLLAAFPRLPSVGSGCRGAAADRDRHVMIISLGALSLSSRSLPPPPSLPAAPVLPLGGGRSRCRLRADSGCGGGGGGARREHGRPPGAAVAPLSSHRHPPGAAGAAAPARATRTVRARGLPPAGACTC